MGKITMEDNFVLSEKRRELFIELEMQRGFPILPKVFALIEKQDKEFIRLLKEEIKEGLRNLEGMDVVKRINKLAGKKLSEGEGK